MDNLDKFREYLNDKERSIKTIEIYTKDIRDFLEHYKDKPLDGIHNIDMRNYKEHLLYDRCLDGKTVNRKLIAIHQYLKFNEIPANTMQVKIQTQNFLEDVINKDEIDKIIDIAISKKDYRAIALLKGLSLTGMRISELLSIEVKDMNLSTIRVLGKGKKFRNVYIPKSVTKAFNDYYNKGRKNTDNRYLFTGIRGRLTRSGADRIFKEYGMLANIDKKKNHCHNLRHSYVRRGLTEKDIPITVMADLVGHTNIETTRQYATFSKEQLIRVIEDLD